MIREARGEAADLDEPIEVDVKTINDIHILSDGNPRETHLIAHHISKAFADGRTEKFEITSDVLDDIINQLGDISHHETLRKIRALCDDELEQLALIATHEGLSVEQEALLMLAFDSFESSKGLSRNNISRLIWSIDDIDKPFLKVG